MFSCLKQESNVMDVKLICGFSLGLSSKFGLRQQEAWRLSTPIGQGTEKHGPQLHMSWIGHPIMAPINITLLSNVHSLRGPSTQTQCKKTQTQIELQASHGHIIRAHITNTHCLILLRRCCHLGLGLYFYIRDVRTLL